MLDAGRLQPGRIQRGTGEELSVIAAAVLGATDQVLGCVIGAMFVGLVGTGLILVGLDVSQQIIIQGVNIIIAVALTRKR